MSIHTLTLSLRAVSSLQRCLEPALTSLWPIPHTRESNRAGTSLTLTLTLTLTLALSLTLTTGDIYTRESNRAGVSTPFAPFTFPKLCTLSIPLPLQVGLPSKSLSIVWRHLQCHKPHTRCDLSVCHLDTNTDHSNLRLTVSPLRSIATTCPSCARSYIIISFTTEVHRDYILLQTTLANAEAPLTLALTSTLHNTPKPWL